MEHWRYYIVGRSLEALGRGPGAIESYKSALRAEPGFHRASNRIAYLLSALGRFGEAEPYFSETLRADPENAVAHFNLGYTFDKRGEYEKAVKSFQKATRLKPALDRAWYGLGLAQAHLGRHQEAAAALQEMNPHAWYQLGMAYHTLRNPEKVTEVAMHLLRFDPRMTRRLIQDAGRSDLTHLVKDLMV